MITLALLSVALSAAPLETFTLPDGLDVVVVPESPSQRCSVRIVVRAGASDDGMGRYGLAHLVEHVVMGSPRAVDLTFRSASVVNALTMVGATIYTLETDAASCAGELAELVGVVTDGKLRRRWFLSQQDVVSREAAQREGDLALVDQSFFGNAPALVHGTAETRLAIQHADVVRFYQRNYVPERMAVVVVGLGADAVREALAKEFRLGPSLPSERTERTPATKTLSGLNHVAHLKPGAVQFVTAVPFELLRECRVAAAALELRLGNALGPRNARWSSSCLPMYGQLVLSLAIRTTARDEARVTDVVGALWTKLPALSAAEAALVKKHLAVHSPSASKRADDLAHTAAWLRGEALFTRLGDWWEEPTAAELKLGGMRAFMDLKHSSIIVGNAM